MAMDVVGLLTPTLVVGSRYINEITTSNLQLCYMKLDIISASRIPAD